MKDNPARRYAIIVAIILGFALIIYLGGLLAQLTEGYQDWLAWDGTGSGAEMQDINFSPLHCIPYSLGSGTGLKSTGVIILISPEHPEGVQANLSLGRMSSKLP